MKLCSSVNILFSTETLYRDRSLRHIYSTFIMSLPGLVIQMEAFIGEQTSLVNDRILNVTLTQMLVWYIISQIMSANKEISILLILNIHKLSFIVTSQNLLC